MGGDPFIRTGSSVKANKPRVGPLADCSKPENSFPVLVDRTDVVVILIFVTVKFEGVELKFSFSRVAFAQPAIDRPNPNDAGSIVHDSRDVSRTETFQGPGIVSILPERLSLGVKNHQPFGNGPYPNAPLTILPKRIYPDRTRSAGCEPGRCKRCE